MTPQAQRSFIETKREAYKANVLKAPDRAWVEKAARLFTYIHHHLFDEELKAGRALKACTIRDHVFQAQFKERTGFTVARYITHLRMEVTRRILAHEDLTVADIARGIGYTHPNIFRVAFKRTHGQTPTAFRNTR